MAKQAKQAKQVGQSKSRRSQRGGRREEGVAVPLDRVHLGPWPNRPRLRLVTVDDLEPHVCWSRVSLVQKAESLGLPTGLPTDRGVTLRQVLPILLGSTLSRDDVSAVAFSLCWYAEPEVVLRWLLADVVQGFLDECLLPDPHGVPSDLSTAVALACSAIRAWAVGRASKDDVVAAIGAIDSRSSCDNSNVSMVVNALLDICFYRDDEEITIDAVVDLVTGVTRDLGQDGVLARLATILGVTVPPPAAPRAGG